MAVFYLQPGSRMLQLIWCSLIFCIMMSFSRFIYVVLLFVFPLFVCAQEKENSTVLKMLMKKNILTKAEVDSLMEVQRMNDSIIENEIKYIPISKRGILNKYNMQVGVSAFSTLSFDNLNSSKSDATVRALFIHVKGQLHKNFHYFAMADIKSAKLIDYYFGWSPNKKVSIQFGQQKIPISIENQRSPSNLEFIYNTRSVVSLIGMGADVISLQNGQNNFGRDMGLKISGKLFSKKEYDLVEYGVGLFQGSGINTSIDRSNKDFTGNIFILPIKNLRLGGGLYFGEAVYKDGGEQDQTLHIRNRWVLSGEYTSKKIYARAEYIRGKDGNINKKGIYGMMQWSLNEKWHIVNGVDHYSNNISKNSEATDYKTGLNYIFHENCRAQINYLYSDYSKAWKTADNHSIAIQLQVVF
ncbi:hypothetical protein CMT34_17220 [Elizabethkingia anophelis]|nr:hypothetical protein [Elizabethkingia anophelis]